MEFNCYICDSVLAENAETDPKVSATKCGHLFHNVCLQDYLPDNNNECPKCQKSLSDKSIKKLFVDFGDSSLETDVVCLRQTVTWLKGKIEEYYAEIDDWKQKTKTVNLQAWKIFDENHLLKTQAAETKMRTELDKETMALLEAQFQVHLKKKIDLLSETRKQLNTLNEMYSKTDRYNREADKSKLSLLREMSKKVLELDSDLVNSESSFQTDLIMLKNTTTTILNEYPNRKTYLPFVPSPVGQTMTRMSALNEDLRSLNNLLTRGRTDNARLREKISRLNNDKHQKPSHLHGFISRSFLSNTILRSLVDAILD